MARIPEQDIERLKEEVSVERLIEAAGIELKKTGKDLAGRCPFHEDDTASLIVTPAKNLWHCFGCQMGGGPIDWVMKRNGVSFRHAVELLREGIPSLVAGSERVKRTSVRALPAPVAFDADDQALLNQTITYYHERLLATSEAAAYLQSRGLSHPELAATFRLGVADRSLGLRLPEKNRKAGAEVRARLQKVGLLRESGHEHFNGSLVVPIFDEHGNVVEVYGRKLLDNLRTGTPKHLYLPAEKRSGGRGVFNLTAVREHREIILCEAILDALSFWCAGYRNVTTAYGIEGFTDDMLAAFKQYKTERVLIAYDRDEPGERAAEKLAARLMAEGIECFRIQFPKGMDANAYALKVQPAGKSLGLLIRKAVWLGKGTAPAQPDSVPQIAAAQAAPVFAVEPSSLVAASAVPQSEPEPLPASPMPRTAQDIPIEVNDKDITLTLGEGKEARRYRVRGLQKNLSVDVLKVNVMVTCDERFHVDTLDLYNAKARGHYVAQALQETGVDAAILRADLGRVLLALEGLQDETIQKALQPAPALAMSEEEQHAAREFLCAPNLVERLLADFALCGLVGEETNKLVGYLAAVSRKLDRPLGVVVQSSSAAGKSSLMDAVLAFVPEEDKVQYSAMTGQSLFYMGETNLKHKALAIVEEEGASRASYALKLLQSEGELTIASTGKDAATGNLITQQYRVEGPVALLLTTTARDLDEELMNRCLVLSVDEGREQTRAIHARQRARRTLEGLMAKQEKAALITLHQNAQRLLRPLDVLNPFAQFLTFPDQTTRLRRDHEKYLTLIDTIAFVHQHQRTVKTVRRGDKTIEYIEVTLADIEQANVIAHEVLGRSLDELPPQTRRLLKQVDPYVRSECERQSVKRSDFHFSRRALREAINWGDTQLKIHLARLVELEYIVTHRTKTNGFDYELVYDIGESDSLRFPGLADIEVLKHAYDVARSGQTEAWSAPGRGLVGPWSVGGRSEELPAEKVLARLSDDMGEADDKTHSSLAPRKRTSYAQPAVVATAATAQG